MRIRLALTGVVLVLGYFAVPAVASTITWSAPRLIDQRLPFAVPEGITDVACPSVHLCVGTQASGIEISRHPLGGARAWAITALPVTPGFPLGPISCASPRFCVAMNDRGQVFASTNPTGGAVAWKQATVGALGQASALSCPQVRFCIAMDGADVVVSTNPTRPTSWQVIPVSAGGAFESLACPSRKLCVGTVGSGAGSHFLTTTNPTGPGYEWQVTPKPGADFGASSIACPTTHLCVATDGVGHILSSTDPARRRWNLGRLPGSGPPAAGYDLASLSCPSKHLCMSVSRQTVAVSTHPAGGARTWTASGQPSTYLGAGGLTCASARLCVATRGDLVFATPHPGGGAATWRSSYLDQGYNPLTAIACPSDQLCVGIDAGGNLITSNAPAASATAWSLAPLTIGSQTSPMPNLACPSTSWCAATTSSGKLITSADPSSAAAWSATGLNAPINDVSCPTATFCVGSDGSGQIHVSGNPSGDATAWSTQQVGAPIECERQYCNYDPLTAVSCPSANLCATTDGQYVWVSTNPAAAEPTWARSALPSQVQRATLLMTNVRQDFNARQLYCPTDSLCLAASGAALEVTIDPADPAPEWTAMNLPRIVIPGAAGPAFTPYISGLSCVGGQLCVAVDAQGGYAFVGNPADPNSWTATKVDYSSSVPVLYPDSLTAVSCTPTGRCIATDGTGNVIVGTTSG